MHSVKVIRQKKPREGAFNKGMNEGITIVTVMSLLEPIPKETTALKADAEPTWTTRLSVEPYTNRYALP